jgi:hypothetical protein
MDGRIDRETDERAGGNGERRANLLNSDGRPAVVRTEGWVDIPTGRWQDGRMDGWMAGRIDGWIGGTDGLLADV